LIASLINLAITWFALYYSNHLYSVLGRQGSDVFSRVMGLILTAIAVELIRSGWTVI